MAPATGTPTSMIDPGTASSNRSIQAPGKIAL
jgi:hypothetical protein